MNPARARKATRPRESFIGRRYFRLAQAAWAKGERDTALRFAEMAVYIDPLNRAAIDLRSDIWQGRPCGDHTLQGGESASEGGNPMDDPATVDAVLNDLEGKSAPPPPQLHPLDPGLPGRKQDILRPRRLE